MKKQTSEGEFLRFATVKAPRKCGPEKYYPSRWPLKLEHDGEVYTKEVVVANQKSCTFFHVWAELAGYKDKEESKQIKDKAWEMCNDMDMEEKDWNDSVTDACKLHVKFRRNGNPDDEAFEDLFTYVLDFLDDDQLDGLNGRELYYAYEYQYLSKPNGKKPKRG